MSLVALLQQNQRLAGPCAPQVRGLLGPCHLGPEHPGLPQASSGMTPGDWGHSRHLPTAQTSTHLQDGRQQEQVGTCLSARRQAGTLGLQVSPLHNYPEPPFPYQHDGGERAS